MTTFKSIDWLRGMAAIIVCWTHILFKADVLVKDKPYLLPYLDALRPSGSPWVNMFFIISGFVIPYSMHHHGYKLSSFKAFIIKRLVRIEPNYLLSIAFILGMSALMALATNTVYKIDWYNVLLQVGYLNVFFQQKWINDVCWTLGIEFQYYVFIALLFTFIVHPKHFVRLITFGGILLAGVGLGMKTTSAFLFDHIPALLIGVSLFLEKIGLISKKVLVFRILLLIPLVLWLYPESNVWFLFFTALMIYFDIDIRWKPLYFLG